MSALDRARSRPPRTLAVRALALFASVSIVVGCGGTSATTSPAPATPAPSGPSPSAAATPVPPPATAATPAPAPTDEVYVVGEGDTLWAIAQKYGTSVAQLVDANPQLTNPDVLRIGDRITIPAEARTLATSGVARAHASRTDARALAAGIGAFGLDLYHALAIEDGNVVFSPASIEIALSMARAGAGGETAAQMDRVLGADWETQAAGINAIDQEIGAIDLKVKDELGTPHEVAVHLANAPFVQRGLALQPAYLDRIASIFGAGARLVDYAADADAARLTINAWVDQQTQRRIPNLLSPPDVTSATRLTLVNAIYLKAPWDRPFEESLTAPARFTRADGSTVTVPTMQLWDGLAYAKGTGWQATQLPYLGTSLALTIIVPDDLAEFEARRDPTQLEVITGLLDATASQRLVALWLPRFGIETRVALKQTLKALGMPLAFDPGRADFSGIALAPCAQTPDCLRITDVIHQANIDVDEKGTEAAAATAVVMETGGGPEESDFTKLRVDRPFLFLLRDTSSGAILFMGRVVDPSTR